MSRVSFASIAALLLMGGAGFAQTPGEQSPTLIPVLNYSLRHASGTRRRASSH
jgi:hypothetical protein